MFNFSIIIINYAYYINEIKLVEILFKNFTLKLFFILICNYKSYISIILSQYFLKIISKRNYKNHNYN